MFFFTPFTYCQEYVSTSWHHVFVSGQISGVCFFPSTLWVSGMALRASGLVVDAFTHWGISPALVASFLLSLAKFKLTRGASNSVHTSDQTFSHSRSFVVVVDYILSFLVHTGWGRGWRSKDKGTEIAGVLTFALVCSNHDVHQRRK